MPIRRKILMEANGAKPAVLQRLGEGENIIINCTPFGVGRSKTANLMIPSLNISRNHCQFTNINNETWFIKDLSSSGTFLNDVLIGTGRSVIVKNSDVIRFGNEESGFVWKFITDSDCDAAVENMYKNKDMQSQAIVDMCNKKDTLEKKLILNQECKMKMNIEIKHHLNQLRELKEKFALTEKGVNESMELKEMNKDIQIQLEKEKNKKEKEDMEEKLLKLQDQIAENNKLEEELKQEIEQLNSKLISEKNQWEKRLSEEKRLMEEKISEESKKLADEKMKVEEISMKHEQELRNKQNILENITDIMENEFQCSVCSEIFVTAITLNCTHTFCKYCIDRWKKKKKNCPVCRKRITSENRSIVIDNYIDTMVEKLSEEFKAHRKLIIAERLSEVPSKKSKQTPHI